MQKVLNAKTPRCEDSMFFSSSSSVFPAFDYEEEDEDEDESACVFAALRLCVKF